MTENRLIHEKSPYLLQHAHNPVDWWPWCSEAFQIAAQEDKPVFLSIGYSTCHWCHVMGRESFSDQEVAQVLNRAFIAIKVDREERPDVDAVYMKACQALTGSGGWPLTILMSPDQKPFWAGTYLPVQSRFGRMGLVDLLERVEELWRTDREQLLAAGEEVTARVALSGEAPSLEPDRAMLHTAFEQFRRDFDRVNGGFGGAPKFPTPHNLLFLLEYARQEEDVRALDMAEKTLVQMARGGIFDHIGGGFCRYSTDVQWLIPHFEKMLYDNALLSYVYLQAHAQTGKPFYREIARRTLNYALEELQLPGGGFACGQDADSQGEEGKFYLLSPEEVSSVLGDRDASRLCGWLDITYQGNFEGGSVPNLLQNAAYDRPSEDLEPLCRRLWSYRRERMDLHRDDKVLTSWNGLMIAALARAGSVLGDPSYLRAAQAARIFVKTRLTTPEGRLLLRWRDREAAHPGQLDDYAFYLWGLLELYAASFSASVLREAVGLAERMLEDFWDEDRGGFYRTAHGAEPLIARPKETYDGAIPSGNAVAALVLARLGKLTATQRFRRAAEAQLRWLAGNLRDYPAGHSLGLVALMEVLYPSQELVCTSPEAAPERLAALTGPGWVHTLVKTPENERALGKLAPFTADYPIPETGAAYYLCRDGACAAPVHDLEDLVRRLEDRPVAAQ